VLSPSGWLAAPELIVRALYGAALVTPLAFSAAVLGARLQHQSDMVGLYGANLLVNGVLLACLGGMAWFSVGESIALYVVGWMAIGLLAAMVARLLWQLHRLALARRGCSGAGDSADSTTRRRPEVLDWCAAIVVAGGPIVLYLVARSLAARDGTGALSTFNYAWKLVELPQLLAVQLVATLALPAVSKGCAGPGDAWRIVFHRAFALAWVLACSAVVVVVWGSESISDAMYGWGRMDGAAVQAVAGWARSGAWCLLPSAAVYMWLVLFASRGRLQQVASTWLVVGTLAIAAGWSWVDTGSKAMVWLNVTWLAMAAAMFWRSIGLLQASVPWLELLWPTLLAGVAGIVAGYAGLEWRGLPVGLACMACILLVAWGTSSSFRCAVQLRSA
jgi:peptidoglycan biosynthesis protein MviN/MurJ (putative lipid II flippase)